MNDSRNIDTDSRGSKSNHDESLGPYATVHRKILDDSKYRSLSPLARFLCCYLLFGRGVTALPGLQKVSLATIADDLGVSIESARDLIGDLSSVGFSYYDETHRVLRVPNAPKYHPAQSPNQLAAWFKHWNEIPDCELKQDHFLCLQEYAGLEHESHLQKWLLTFAADDPFLPPRWQAKDHPRLVRKIMERDEHACVYCEARKPITVSQMTPRSRRGTGDERNLCTICVSCVSQKRDMDYMEFISFLERKGKDVRACRERISRIRDMGQNASLTQASVRYETSLIDPSVRPQASLTPSVTVSKPVTKPGEGDVPGDARDHACDPTKPVPPPPEYVPPCPDYVPPCPELAVPCTPPASASAEPNPRPQTSPTPQKSDPFSEHSTQDQETSTVSWTNPETERLSQDFSHATRQSVPQRAHSSTVVPFAKRPSSDPRDLGMGKGSLQDTGSPDGSVLSILGGLLPQGSPTSEPAASIPVQLELMPGLLAPKEPVEPVSEREKVLTEVKNFVVQELARLAQTREVRTPILAPTLLAAKASAIPAESQPLVTPILQPVTPIPEPVTVIQPPVTKIPEPVTPILPPVTPVRESVTPVKDPVTPVREPVIKPQASDRPVPVVHCPTVEHGLGFHPDEALQRLRSTTAGCKRGQLGRLCSGAQMQELAEIARSASPRPLTLEDFETLGKAWAAGVALKWKKDPTDMGFLLRNGGAHLLSAMLDAFEWRESQMPRAKPAPAAVKSVGPKPSGSSAQSLEDMKKMAASGEFTKMFREQTAQMANQLAEKMNVFAPGVLKPV